MNKKQTAGLIVAIILFVGIFTSISLSKPYQELIGKRAIEISFFNLSSALGIDMWRINNVDAIYINTAETHEIEKYTFELQNVKSGKVMVIEYKDLDEMQEYWYILDSEQLYKLVTDELGDEKQADIHQLSNAIELLSDIKPNENFYNQAQDKIKILKLLKEKNPKKYDNEALYLFSRVEEKVPALQAEIRESIIDNYPEWIRMVKSDAYKKLGDTFLYLRKTLNKLWDKLSEETKEEIKNYDTYHYLIIWEEGLRRKDHSYIFYSYLGKPYEIKKSGIEEIDIYRDPGFEIYYEKNKGVYRVKDLIPISVAEKELYELGEKLKKWEEEWNEWKEEWKELEEKLEE